MRKCFSLFLISILLVLNMQTILAVEVQIQELQEIQIHLKKEEVKTLVFELEEVINEPEIEWIISNEKVIEINLVNNKWNVKGLNYGSSSLIGYVDGEIQFNILVQVFDSMVFKSEKIQLDIHETFNTELVFQPAAFLEGFEPAYVSSDVTVASVSAEGLITGLKVGKSTITGSYLGQTATLEVEVIDRPDFVYTETRQTLDVDSSVNILYRTSLFGPNIDKTIEWKSSNENVASVDNKGVVYGISSGTATITATVNNKEYKTMVEVISNVEEIKMKTEEIRLSVNEEVDIEYEIIPTAYADTPVTWLSSRPSVARVSNGQVRGISAGEATITAKINNVESEVRVIVDVPLTGLSVSPNRINLQQGQRFHLRVLPKPSNSSMPLSLKYRSSNVDIAEVDDFGNITAKSPGQALIFINQESFSTSMEVTVLPSEDESGQFVVLGSLNSNQVVSFDLRGLERLGDYILEIPLVSRVNNIGQMEVVVTLDDLAFTQQTLQVFGIQLTDGYLDKDINLVVSDNQGNRIFNYQFFNFKQVKQNLYPRMSRIESPFNNFKGHLVEVEVPITLSRMDKLIIHSRYELNDEDKIYQAKRNSLNLVSARNIDLENNQVVTFSQLEKSIYYLTDQPLESRIMMFLFITVGFISLITSFFVIKRYNEQEIVLEEEKRSHHESVNFEQQKNQEES